MSSPKGLQLEIGTKGVSSRMSSLKARWELLVAGCGFARDIPRLLPWVRMSPAALLRERARRNPGHCAIAYRDERYTWAQVEREAMRYAAWFSSQSVRRGDVVALLMDNRPAFLFAFMGLSRLGAVAALVNTNLRDGSLAHALQIAAPSQILVGAEHVPAIRAVLGDLERVLVDKHLYVHLGDGVSRAADFGDLRVIDDELADSSGTAPFVATRNSDLCCYVYTSGTTGLPKAAVIRNQRIVGGGVSFGRIMHRCGPGDLIYVALPLYHSSALFLGWGAALATGAAIGLRGHFSVSEFFSDVRRFRATSFLYIGELCRYLLNSPPQEGERDHSLRVAVGNGLRPELWAPLTERFGIPVVREFYGATEGNAPLLNHVGKPGMIGRMSRGQAVIRCDAESGVPARNVEGLCESVAPGEIGLLVGRISRTMNFDGYLDARATESKILTDVVRAGDRYFNTGDLVALHPGGWLSFSDRVGDTYRWKGENVSTSEVEQLLGTLEGVEEVSVIGVLVPGEEGRAGMAAVRLRGDFAPAEFAEACRARLPAYMQPLVLRILEGGMQTTSTFKHQKAAYRKQGYDPRDVGDRLFAAVGGTYALLDEALYQQIQSGDVTLGLGRSGEGGSV